MATVTVPVIAAFEHQGRMFSAGATITVAPVEAAALARQGVVSLASGAAPPVRTAETPVPRKRGRPRKYPEGTRRTYRRRDLVPEP